MISPDALAELQTLCGEAKEMAEGGNNYVFLPSLKLPLGSDPAEVGALLCLNAREGYPTRLFLSARVNGKGNNWTEHRILDRTWHTWSWNNVPSDLRPMQILLDHLRAFR